MSRSLNKAMLIGHAGKDPVVNYTQNAIPVATVTLATSYSRRDRDGGGNQEHTDWHTVVAWRELAEIMQKMVHKGSKIFVEGRIQNRSYDDKDGNKRYITEIVADNIIVLDGRPKENNNDANASHPAADAASDDDIPF